MSTVADRAKDNAISLEVKKDGLQQRQSGDWMLRFTVASIDMDNARNHPLVMAAMGTRYQCVLVEVGDDEEPVDHGAVVRDKWRELGATRQAGMRCKDPVFWAFLEEELHYVNVRGEEDAAQIVRNICGIGSRRDLDNPAHVRAKQQWFDLDNAFQAWRLREKG